MKLLYLFILLFTISFAEDSTNNSKSLHEQNLHKQMEKEKKYAQEQKFYQGQNYDLDSFEVDDKSLKNIPDQPDYNENFDMNNVYD